MLSIKSRPLPPAGTAAWVTALEDELLAAIPNVGPLRTAAQRQEAFDNRGDFVLDMPAAFERDQAARSRSSGRPA